MKYLFDPTCNSYWRIQGEGRVKAEIIDLRYDEGWRESIMYWSFNELVQGDDGFIEVTEEEVNNAINAR